MTKSKSLIKSRSQVGVVPCTVPPGWQVKTWLPSCAGFRA